MQKIAVIYQSKYGHAMDYAGWLAQALGADLFEAPKPRRLDRYDTLIFGGGIYAGGVSGAKLLARNLPQWRNKHLIVFTVGLSATDDPAAFRPVIERSYPAEVRERARFFHLRGGIDYKRLGPLHRSMMGMLRMLLMGKRDKTKTDRLLLESYGGRVDFRDKESIRPIVEYVCSLEGRPC